MAETKIVSIEAIESIQQLKENIKALKTEVDSLTVGSEEYNDKVLELAENQRALKLAMTGVYGSMKEVADASRMDTNAINQTVAASKQGTATYYEMSAALGELKKEVKSVPKYLSEQAQAIGEINPAYTELNEKIKTLDSSLKELDADNGVFGRNVGNYKGALEEWGGTMGQVRQIGGDLMSGILALVGVMSMFGADTEDTKETLQELVPVIAILNSAKGLGGLGKLFKSTSAAQKALTVTTVANTAANTANATSAGAATVATEAMDKAQDKLNKTMLANPILAVVAAIIALVAAVAKYVSNSNKAAKETREWAKQEKELNEKFEVQNDELDRQQKILAAQGTSNQVLLAQKKENIKAQKLETEALVQNIKARVDQMKADSAWVRFWKGENKQIKNLEEQLKGLNEQIKGFDNALADIDADIQVDLINKAKDSAKKYSDTLKSDVKNAVSIANAAIKSQRTEMQGLNEEYLNNENILKSGLTAVNAILTKSKKGSKEYTQALKDQNTITNGLAANTERYKNAVEDINKKNYIKDITADFKSLSYEIGEATKQQRNLERLTDAVLGFSDAQQLALKSTDKDFVIGSTQATKNLISTYQYLTKINENTIRFLADFGGKLEDLEINGIKWDELLKMSQSDADELAKEVGEPLATAIGEWFKNNNELDNAVFKGLEESIAQGMSLFNDAISRGDENAAEGLKEMMLNVLRAAFPSDDPTIQAIINQFLINLQKSINDVVSDDKYTLDFGKKFTAILGSSGFTNEFDAILKIADDFNQAYVASTADALNEVANLWETSIKLKYKKLVESGKMTEEQAQKQAEAEFENVKALQIGIAAVNTAAAIVSALADPNVPSYFVRAANAIAAGAAGAAQIMSISMTEFGKPSININGQNYVPSYTPEPQPMYYSMGINPMDYAEASAQNPVKVYVTDQDLAEGIDNYNSRRAEVTF